MFLLAPALACGTGLVRPTSTPVSQPTAASPAPATTVVPPTAIVLPSVTPVPVVDLTGEYAVAGANFDGSTYQGQATISRSGVSFNIEWRIGPGTQIGAGTFDGETFAVRWTTPDGQAQGDATYTLQADGSLSGTWTVDGVNGQGVETLTPLD